MNKRHYQYIAGIAGFLLLLSIIGFVALSVEYSGTKDKLNESQQQVTSLETEIDDRDRYSLINYQAVKDRGWTANETHEIMRDYRDWKGYMEAFEYVRNQADSLEENGQYEEAAAYSTASKYYIEEAKEEVKAVRENLRNEDERATLRQAIKGYQRLETYYDHQLDLMYARESDHFGNATEIENKMELVRLDIQDNNLDVELGNGVFSNPIYVPVPEERT